MIQLPEAGGPEGITPKLFDPGLTQGVDKIVWPKTTAAPSDLNKEQMLNVVQGQSVNPEVEGEIAQVMLKTPQIRAERSPSIDFAKAEIDPQLMNMEDFVAQKTLAVKKPLNNTSAYGIPTKNQVTQAGAETGLKSTQTINELGATEAGTNSSSMSSQQFILNSQIDLGASSKVATFKRR